MQARKRILVVDDVRENVLVLKAMLSSLYDIEQALSGAEALSSISRAAPDLVLLDLMMPAMDGMEFLARLRQSPAHATLPVIIVTAKDDARSESEAIAAGAIDFIGKPVNLPVVRARVALHLQLKTREAELQLLNEELETRVSERTHALEDALIRAETANRAKDAFIANMSHELRTPLNGILGMAELLLHAELNPRQHKHLTTIRKSGDQLLGLIEDLLDFSRLEAGKLALTNAVFDLPALLEKTLADVRDRTAAKGLGLSLAISPRVARHLNGDAQQLKRVLMIYLDNAIKFTANGDIAVSVALEQQDAEYATLRIEVRDTGIGLSLEQQSLLFQRFRQIDDSTTRNYGGTGLGLAIAQQLAGLLNGRVGVESSPGRGSRFWFSATLALARPSAVETRENPQAAPALSAPATPAPGGHINWAIARSLTRQLVELLEQDDIQSQQLWLKNESLLADILGQQAGRFQASMECFDLAAALEALNRSLAAEPRLCAPS